MLSANEANGPGEQLLTQGAYGPFELRLEYRWVSGGQAGVGLFLGSSPGVEIKLSDDSNVTAFNL